MGLIREIRKAVQRRLRLKTPHLTGTGRLQEAAYKIESRGLFVGCPIEVFEYTSRDLWTIALLEGLKPSSTVLDVGCGCLRTGYWFIQHLEPGKYHGIEPHKEMLQAGLDLVIAPVKDAKRPTFSNSDQFDFSSFGRKFDFVVAFSIWTHASKGQIRKMLDEFKATAAPGAKFISSYLEPREGLPDYLGDTWVGKSHNSKVGGLVAHEPEWLRREVESRGLMLRHFEPFTTLRQRYAIITAS